MSDEKAPCAKCRGAHSYWGINSDGHPGYVACPCSYQKPEPEAERHLYRGAPVWYEPASGGRHPSLGRRFAAFVSEPPRDLGDSAGTRVVRLEGLGDDYREFTGDSDRHTISAALVGHVTPRHEEPQSRSMQRRMAAQRGLPPPVFGLGRHTDLDTQALHLEQGNAPDILVSAAWDRADAAMAEADADQARRTARALDDGDPFAFQDAAVVIRHPLVIDPASAAKVVERTREVLASMDALPRTPGEIRAALVVARVGGYEAGVQAALTLLREVFGDMPSDESCQAIDTAYRAVSTLLLKKDEA